jgi:hypothetical protein
MLRLLSKSKFVNNSQLNYGRYMVGEFGMGIMEVGMTLRHAGGYDFKTCRRETLRQAGLILQGSKIPWAGTRQTR